MQIIDRDNAFIGFNFNLFCTNAEMPSHFCVHNHHFGIQILSRSRQIFANWSNQCAFFFVLFQQIKAHRILLNISISISILFAHFKASFIRIMLKKQMKMEFNNVE